MGESGARNQVANFRKRSVVPQTHAGAGKSHPDLSTAFLHGARQRTVVNQLSTNCGHPTDALESATAQHHATARRSGRAGMRVGNPARRIEHQEKIEKRRNQKPFRKCLRLQEHHERREVERITDRAENQAAQRVWRMHHIRIGEPKEYRGFFRRREDSFV